MSVTEPSPQQRLEEATGINWRTQENQLVSDAVPYDAIDNPTNIAAMGHLARSINAHLKSGRSSKTAYPQRGRFFPVAVCAPDEEKEKGVWLSIHPDDAEQICDGLKKKPGAQQAMTLLSEFIAAPLPELAKQICNSFREEPTRTH